MCQAVFSWKQIKAMFYTQCDSRKCVWHPTNMLNIFPSSWNICDDDFFKSILNLYCFHKCFLASSFLLPCCSALGSLLPLVDQWKSDWQEFVSHNLCACVSSLLSSTTSGQKLHGENNVMLWTANGAELKSNKVTRLVTHVLKPFYSKALHTCTGVLTYSG